MEEGLLVEELGDGLMNYLKNNDACAKSWILLKAFFLSFVDSLKRASLCFLEVAESQVFGTWCAGNVSKFASAMCQSVQEDEKATHWFVAVTWKCISRQTRLIHKFPWRYTGGFFPMSFFSFWIKRRSLQNVYRVSWSSMPEEAKAGEEEEQYYDDDDEGEATEEVEK